VFLWEDISAKRICMNKNTTNIAHVFVVEVQKMADLIDRSLLEPDAGWDDYDDGFTTYSRLQIEDAPTVEASLNIYASLEPFGDTGSAYHDRWICTNCHRTCRSESWGTKCDYERCPHCGAIICGGEK
jgi:hypothetical protein